MKNYAVSVLLALISMHLGYSDSVVTFECTLNPDQFSQDFKIDTLVFSVNQGISGVSFVSGSLKSVPTVDQFQLIDNNTKTACDLTGTPATAINQDLAIMGQDVKNGLVMLLTLDAPTSRPYRRADIDIYPTPSNVSQPPQLEAHLWCTQKN